MVDTLPPDLTQFIQEELASGHYSSEQEVVREAVRFFRESRERFRQLKDEIRQRITGMDAGLSTDINSDEDMAQFFRDIESEVHRETIE
ncbi:MAG: type II toxin-antitoxin system ParD family antitoxin [Thermoguttaceae bacterium]|jgi:antitoxin ParD1/3/4